MTCGNRLHADPGCHEMVVDTGGCDDGTVAVSFPASEFGLGMGIDVATLGRKLVRIWGDGVQLRDDVLRSVMSTRELQRSEDLVFGFQKCRYVCDRSLLPRLLDINLKKIGSL
jgi:hypothetical protein